MGNDSISVTIIAGLSIVKCSYQRRLLLDDSAEGCCLLCSSRWDRLILIESQALESKFDEMNLVHLMQYCCSFLSKAAVAFSSWIFDDAGEFQKGGQIWMKFGADGFFSLFW